MSHRRRRRLPGVAAAAGALLLGTVTPTPGRAAPEVVVCSSHHQVLPYWLAAWRAGALGDAGATVVHFDAHPDLAPPRSLPRLEDPLAGVDIASFQLAAAWWGLARRFVWVRPPWADQIPDGDRSFLVGEAPGGGLRTDDDTDYYVLDEGWARRDALGRPVRVEVAVVPLDVAGRGLAVEGPWILDIDLDGFATRNPGADHLREAGASEETLETIRRAFAPAHLGLPSEPEARIAALGEVMAAARATAGGPVEALGGLARLWRLGIAPGDLLTLAFALRGEIALDGDAVARSGRYVVGLPEHRAAAAEMRVTARAIAGLVEAVGHPPALVTVARSVEDRYTPRDAWPLAEWSTLQALAAVLPEAQVRFDTGLGPPPRVDPALLER